MLNDHSIRGQVVISDVTIHLPQNFIEMGRKGQKVTKPLIVNTLVKENVGF